MALDDSGIVIGITTYPTLSRLDGPENDANDFYDWLTSSSGGDVPQERVTRIVSSDYQPPKAPAATKQPNASDVETAFRNLHFQAIGSNGVPKRLGRRLYVYVAGHGVGLPFIYDPDRSDAALLTADATEWDAPHVMAKIFALYFLNAGIFEEVVVFMDCCRALYNRLTPRFPTFIDINAISGTGDGRRAFFAFATRWAGAAREKRIGDRTRGIFTTALLRGLKTGGGDLTGKITSTSLRNYLLNHMSDLLTPQEMADPLIPKQPDIPAPNVDLVFGITPSATVKVSVSAPTAAGQAIRIRGDGFKVIAQGQALVGVPWEVTLQRGGYLVEIPELKLEKDFILVGDEEVLNVVIQ
jgi:hypothetical protein